jgi:CheY-like chemotaxis protein
MPDFDAQQDIYTVLLIDDDLVSREVMATVLTMSGYTVHTAAGGAAALDLLAADVCVPGIILMDAQMQGLSGTRLIKKLRARSRAILYAISGSDAPSEVVAAADGFLLKPINPEALHRLLDERQTQLAPPGAQESDPVLPSPPRESSPPDRQPGDPVINPETLVQLREMMSEAAVHQIYAAIVADLFKRLAALEVAIARGDDAEVRRIGHAIKGGCGMAGALQAARLGALIESPVNHLDNNSAVLRDLRAATRNLQRMLEAEFPE